MKPNHLCLLSIFSISEVLTISSLSVKAITTVEVREIAKFSNQLLSESTTPESEQDLSAPEIGKIGKSIVVKIESDRSQGSGVIVKYDGDKYTVLTAFHVVSKIGKYRIIAPDGKQYILGNINIRRIPDIDLATFEFESVNKYHIAQLGDSDSSSEGSTSYVAGFSVRTSSVRSIYRSVDGKISAIDKEFPVEGYGLIYTNDTLEGMSGGAVLNEKGKLIGIHGRKEIEKLSFLDDVTIIPTGFNLGIPINTFKKFASTIASNSQGSSSTVNPYTQKYRNRRVFFFSPNSLHTSALDVNKSNSLDRFFCNVKQNIPGVYARTNRGVIQLIKFMMNVNPENCNLIAKRFQKNFESGNLRGLTTGKLEERMVICAARLFRDSCREETILFEIPHNSESSQILKKLLNRSQLISSPIELDR